MKEPRKITGYKALSPGKYRPQTPPKVITITAQDVKDWVDAVNIKYNIGNPVTLTFTHSQGLAGIEVGVLEKAYLRGEDAYIDMAVLVDAVHKGEIVRTLEQIADGIETGMMSASWEGWQGGYANETYTGKRNFSVWPTGYAVLPGKTQPAIPPGVPISADENQDSAGVFLRNVTIAPDGGNSPTERGHEMTLEEAIKMIATLKAEIVELKKSQAEESNKDELAVKDKEIKDLKAEVKVHEDAAEVALETKAGELQTKVLEKVLAGNRKTTEEDLKALDSPAERVQFLEMLDNSLSPIEAGGTKLDAGDEPGDGEEADEEKKIDAQQKAIYAAADAGKFDMRTIQGNEQATEIAMRDNPELFE